MKPRYFWSYRHNVWVKRVLVFAPSDSIAWAAWATNLPSILRPAP